MKQSQSAQHERLSTVDYLTNSRTLHVSENLFDDDEKDPLKVSPHLYIESNVPYQIKIELTSGRCFGHEIVYSLQNESIFELAFEGKMVYGPHP